jgi:hypothetical protein
MVTVVHTNDVIGIEWSKHLWGFLPTK